MKVAVINTYDSKDIKIWAGIPYHLSLMLDEMFDQDVTYVTLPFNRHKMSYLTGFYFNRIRGKKYLSWADESVILKNKVDNEELLKEDFDLIITFQFFLVPILKKENNKVIYWSDATFKNLINFYPYVTNVSNFSLEQGHSIQKLAFDLSDSIILTSDWAINSAIMDYRTDKRKLKKIFFASNLSTFPGKREINKIINNRDTSIVKLLFLALNWERKGGDEAVELVAKLNSFGVPTLLYVVGDDIPEKHKQNLDIVPFGFINKNSPGGEERMTDLLKESTFLFLPTKADCTPVAFSEANSYALPVVSTNVGGIPSVVNSQNGCSFKSEEFIEGAIHFIMNNLPGTSEYKELCISSFNFYNEELSWIQVKKRFKSVMKDLNLSPVNTTLKLVEN